MTTLRRSGRAASGNNPRRRAFGVVFVLMLLSVPPSNIASAEDNVVAGVTSFRSVGSASKRVVIPADTHVRWDLEDMPHANMHSDGRYGVLVIRAVGDDPLFERRGASIAYVTQFDTEFCWSFGCDVENSFPMTGVGKDPWFDPDGWFMPAGVYEVLLLADGGREVTAELEFKGLSGTSSVDVTEPVVGVTSAAVQTRITTLTGRDDVVGQAQVRGWAEGMMQSRGVALFAGWVESENIIDYNFRSCTGRPGLPVFDAEGMCTGNGYRSWESGWGLGPLVGRIHEGIGPACNWHEASQCGVGPVRWAFEGTWRALKVRAGGVGIWLGWP